MEPVTHALASMALARAAFDKTRLAAPIAVAASLAVDLDWLSIASGAEFYLFHHRTLTHSLIGSAVVAAAAAGTFWFTARKNPAKPLPPLQAITVALAAVWLHLLLDLLNPHGVGLLWPFSARRFAWDLVTTLDIWLLGVLLVGWVFPTLLRLVTEEIGAKAERKGPRRWAMAALVLVVIYCGARWYAHGNAVALLDSRMYHGAVPRAVAALPDSPSPLKWRGIVETDDTFEEVDVPLGPGGYFDSDNSATLFKPEASPALEAALKRASVQRYVAASRFPLAAVEPMPPQQGLPAGGFRIRVRDLRFTPRTVLVRAVVLIVELDANLAILDERFEFQDLD